MVTLTLHVAVVVFFSIVAPLADLFPRVIKGTRPIYSNCGRFDAGVAGLIDRFSSMVVGVVSVLS
jgi:hypothetical protein